MLDPEVAKWLTGLIVATMAHLEEGAGLTCEVDGDPQRWVQVIPEADREGERLGGFTLNFAFRHEDEPLSVLRRVSLKPPPDTKVEQWEAGGYARLWIRPDVPVVALALFVGDIFEKVQEAPAGYELAARIEYGY